MTIQRFYIYENHDSDLLGNLRALLLQYAKTTQTVSLCLRKTGDRTSFSAFYKELVLPLESALGFRLKLEIETADPDFEPSVLASLDQYAASVVLLVDSSSGPGLADMEEQTLFPSLRDLKLSLCYQIDPEASETAEEVFQKLSLPYAFRFRPSVDSGPCEGEPESCAADFYLDSYKLYLKQLRHNRILTIDRLAHSFYFKRPHRSAYTADTLVIDGQGLLYPSLYGQRKELCIGSLSDSLLWTDTKKRFEACFRADPCKNCRTCEHSRYCPGSTEVFGLLRETEGQPLCAVYRELFSLIGQEAKMERLALWQNTGEDLPLISMVTKDEHPYDLRRRYEHALEAVKRGQQAGEWTYFRKTEDYSYPIARLYFSLTYDCPLRCSHCFADGGIQKSEEMSAADYARITEDAIAHHIGEVVISGGEPFVYRDFDELLERLGSMDKKGTIFTLRSSLGFSIPEARLKQAAEVFDRIIVSLDGDEAYHDARRGRGRYRITTGYIEQLIDMGYRDKVMLCAVMSQEDRNGAPGRAVRNYADSHGLSLRINQIRPIGRGKDVCDKVYHTNPDIEYALRQRFYSPINTCGLGYILEIKPDGSIYPCYAVDTPEHYLGNIRTTSFDELWDRGLIRKYQCCTVDTNEKCKACTVRYLCGGMCKTWANDVEDIDRIDFDCSQTRAFLEQIAGILLAHEHTQGDLLKSELSIT